MEDTQSVSTLIDSTSSKILQLQKAFAELESHSAGTLNLKWTELEEHFHGLEKSLNRQLHELEDQEKLFEAKVIKLQELLEKREAAVAAKEQASMDRLQKKRDAAVLAISTSFMKHRKVTPADPCICEGKSGHIVEEKMNDDVTAPESCIEDPEDPCEDESEETLSWMTLSSKREELLNSGNPNWMLLTRGCSSGNSLEAYAFLQLLVTFGIASDYEGYYSGSNKQWKAN